MFEFIFFCYNIRWIGIMGDSRFFGNYFYIVIIKNNLIGCGSDCEGYYYILLNLD